MNRRNDRKIDRTVKAFNEIKETLTIAELISFQSSLVRYIKSRETAEKKGVMTYRSGKDF